MLKTTLEFMLPRAEKMWGAPGNLLQVGKGRDGLKRAAGVTQENKLEQPLAAVVLGKEGNELSA